MRDAVEYSKTIGDEICDELARSCTPLLGVYSDERGEGIGDYGSGTLVSVSGTPCIMTAYHVAERLQNYPLLGLGVQEDVHRYAIPMEYVRTVKVGRPTMGKESRGPDLAVLILPQNEKGKILAWGDKVIWNLDKHRNDAWPEPRERSKALWAVVGFPEERSKVGRGVSFMGGVVGVATRANSYQRGVFNYIDVNVKYVKPADPPKSLKGMSGGGMWLLSTRRGPRGDLVWSGERALAGVLFYQTREAGASRVARCHGWQDIYERAYEAVRRELQKSSPTPLSARGRCSGKHTGSARRRIR